MKRILLSTDIPSIIKYRKDGIYLRKDKYTWFNFSEYYIEDKEKSLNYLDYLIDECDNIKNKIQLKDFLKDLLDEK